MTRLTLGFTKLNEQRHRFAYRREGGGGESVELETRSFLMHDLIHFAVESEAQLGQSFYGRLAAGSDLQSLTADVAGQSFTGEWGVTERVVGALTNLADETDPEAFARRVAAFIEGIGEQTPAYLTADFVSRVQAALRSLKGRWKATPFGETLELTFTAPD